MLEPTGSVYLDAPKPPSRRSDTSRAEEPRTALAVVVAVVGLVSLSIAAMLGVTRAAVHDPDTAVGPINAALDDADGRANLEAEIADAINGTLFGPEVSAELTADGIDAEAAAAHLAPIVLDDPTFRAALTDLVVATHERVLLESTDEPLDMTAITSATRAVIVDEMPDVAAVLPASNALYVVTADQIPDLTTPFDLLDRAVLALAIGGLLLPLAYLLHPERHRVVRWVGRCLLVGGVAGGLAAIGLPWLAARVTGSELVGIAARSMGLRLLAPALVAAILGVGVMAAAWVLKSRTAPSVVDVGVAAALGGLDDVWPTSTANSSDMELAHRGLVDVSHPLTNI